MRSIIQEALVIVVVLVAAQTPSAAQSQAVLSGTIVDTLGARLAGATVTLIREGQKVQDGKRATAMGRFRSRRGTRSLQVQASMPGFQSKTSEAVFVGRAAVSALRMTLRNRSAFSRISSSRRARRSNSRPALARR